MIGRAFAIFDCSRLRIRARRLKLLDTKGIQLHIHKHFNMTLLHISRCGYAIVMRIVMVKCTAMYHLGYSTTKQNTSSNYIFYEPTRKWAKIETVSLTKFGKQPWYKFFIHYNNHYIPLQYMLDFGSTRFVFSPIATKAFKVPVVWKTKKVQWKDVTAWEIVTEGLDPIPVQLSFGNHCSYDAGDLAFDIMDTMREYDCLLPARDVEKQKAQGTTASQLHFPLCDFHCYWYDTIHPEYSITDHNWVAFNRDPIHIGSLVKNKPSKLDRIPMKYH